MIKHHSINLDEYTLVIGKSIWKELANYHSILSDFLLNNANYGENVKNFIRLLYWMELDLMTASKKVELCDVIL